jgi:serine/threonine protein kinase
VTYDEFVRRLSASRLMTPQMLRTNLQEVPDGQRPRDAQSLARWLVKVGHLTSWQAKVVYSGRTSGLVLGNYVLQDQLGAGGMGEVYKARHLRMQRTVALKVLPEKVAHDESLIARFQREVQAAGRLMHPNIVTAFDADEADSRFFLVMEYVPGRDLASIVRQRGPLPLEQALDCVLDAARGLDYAHRHGIIHRDIKPANLLLMDAEPQHRPDADRRSAPNQRLTVKILDMGLARIDETAGEVGEQAELTGTGVVMGTVDYMAPEQAINTRSADHRSDIYSLGITLHYLLTGQPAYSGSSVMERLVNHREAPIPSLRASRASIPASLDSAFARMVSKQPDERFQSMSEVIAALEAIHSRGAAPDGELTAIAPSDTSDTALASFLRSIETGGATVAVSATQPTRVLSESQAEIIDTLIGQSEDATQTLVKSSAPQHPPRRAATTPAWLWPSAIGGGLFVVGLLVLASLSGPEAPPESVDSGTGSTGGAELQEASASEASHQPFEIPPRFHRSTDREIAEWVLTQRGDFDYVDLYGKKVLSVRELPELEEFLIIGVRLGHGSIPVSLEGLERLVVLDRLSTLTAIVYELTPAHLQTIGQMTALDSLDLTISLPTDVDDNDMAEMLSRLPNLRRFVSRNMPLDGSCLRRASYQLQAAELLSNPAGNVPLPPKLVPEAFAAMRALPNLHALTLDYRALDEAQIAGIATVETLEKMRLVGADGVAENLHLLQQMPRLSQLVIHRTALEDKHLPDLLGFTQLDYLDVSENYLTAEGVERLRQALPNCHIESDFGTFEPSN